MRPPKRPIFRFWRKSGEPFWSPKSTLWAFFSNFFSHVFSHRLQDPNFFDFASMLARFSGLFESTFWWSFDKCKISNPCIIYYVSSTLGRSKNHTFWTTFLMIWGVVIGKEFLNRIWTILAPIWGDTFDPLEVMYEYPPPSDVAGEAPESAWIRFICFQSSSPRHTGVCDEGSAEHIYGSWYLSRGREKV